MEDDVRVFINISVFNLMLGGYVLKENNGNKLDTVKE